MLPKDTKVKIVMHWEDEDGVKRPVAELDNIDLETNDKVLAELDYVRVVRCKDCKHRPHIEKAIMRYRQEIEVCAPEVDGREDYSCMCLNPDNSYFSWMPDDNWFCADGERRDTDGDDQ